MKTHTRDQTHIERRQFNKNLPKRYIIKPNKMNIPASDNKWFLMFLFLFGLLFQTSTWIDREREGERDGFLFWHWFSLYRFVSVLDRAYFSHFPNMTFGAFIVVFRHRRRWYCCCLFRSFFWPDRSLTRQLSSFNHSIYFIYSILFLSCLCIFKLR